MLLHGKICTFCFVLENVNTAENEFSVSMCIGVWEEGTHKGGVCFHSVLLWPLGGGV